MQVLGASQSCMSRHMATLKAAGLVVDRRNAQWVPYRRAPHLPPFVTALVDAALALPAERERIAAGSPRAGHLGGPAGLGSAAPVMAGRTGAQPFLARLPGRRWSRQGPGPWRSSAAA
jgi:hypothetical protein